MRLISDFAVPNAYADLSTPSHASCWDDYRMNLLQIKLLDDHEPIGNPEIYIKSRPRGGGLDFKWKKFNTKNDLDFVDNENELYEVDEHGFPSPPGGVLLYDHFGIGCALYTIDFMDFKVREDDPWPNSPDNVAGWALESIVSARTLTNGTDFGYPGDANIKVVSDTQ